MNFLKKLYAQPTVQYLLKNAVNAAILSLVQMYHDPADNNFHDWHGIKGILWQVGAAILAREGMIVVPKIVKWSTTNGGAMKSIILVVTMLFSVTVAQAQGTKPPVKKRSAFVTFLMHFPGTALSAGRIVTDGAEIVTSKVAAGAKKVDEVYDKVEDYFHNDPTPDTPVK